MKGISEFDSGLIQDFTRYFEDTLQKLEIAGREGQSNVCIYRIQLEHIIRSVKTEVPIKSEDIIKREDSIESEDVITNEDNIKSEDI